MRKILIAGASGFIGRALIENLLQLDEVEIVALSRSERVSEHPRISWKRCDLFSLKDITLAMEGCEEAFYLVHSMLPSAALSQGTFYDFDLIMVDNFIRAARTHKLKHLVYLGGMIPFEDELSWHLRSRLEVEEAIRNSGINSTVLRAGLIIGPGGSSFTILKRLIERLPLMVCPKWTNTLSQPVALKDVIRVLIRIINSESVRGKVYDIGGPEVVTYQELMKRASLKIRKSRTLITLNIIPLFISRFWVTLITGVPKDLVYPLVLSLKHEMLASPDRNWPYAEDLKTSLDDALEMALIGNEATRLKGWIPTQKDVRSIQRMVLPEGRNAEWVALEYFHWLPGFFSTLLKVQLDGERCTFYLFNPSIKLLVLERSVERSTPDRQLLYIVGGLLSAKQDRGRLEFREVLGGRYVMAGIHDFRPSLPWFIYKRSQAIIHALVMYAFGEHLKWHVISQKRISI